MNKGFRYKRFVGWLFLGAFAVSHSSLPCGQPSTEMDIQEQTQQAAPQTEQCYWYYCQNPQGYYPDVNNCPGGWMKVVPTTPQ
jgi:hypothetical protein